MGLTGYSHLRKAELIDFINSGEKSYAREDNTANERHNMKIMKGDLIKLAQDGVFDVIVHGCNCMHRMGAGIAKQIGQTFPAALRADKQTARSKTKLGTYSSAVVEGLYVVNAYTQIAVGKSRSQSVKDRRMQALIDVFKLIKRDFAGKRIGIPKIGAGLAGGNWTDISMTISEIMDGEDITVVKYRR